MSAYWNESAVTQKSKVPTVEPELTLNWIVGVLGALVSATPVARPEQIVLKLVQGMVWVAAFITAQ